MDAVAPLAVPSAQPAPRPPWRALALAPLGVALLAVVLAGGLWGYAAQTVARGDEALRSEHYAIAEAAYQRALSLRRLPLTGALLATSRQKAKVGLTRTDLRWADSLATQGQYAQSRARLMTVLADPATEQDRVTARNAMATLLVGWATALEGQKLYQTAIDRLRQVASFDPAGLQRATVQVALPRNYLAEAQRLDADKKYREALPWYRDILREFPDSEATPAARTGLPHVLYEQALLNIEARAYEQARSAMREVVTDYPQSPSADAARTALAAAQPITGRTVGKDDKAPVPNIQVRVVSKWRILRPGVYDDSQGQVYTGTSDAEGRFSIAIPPGEGYLVTWWSPSRNTFITTFNPEYTDSANKVTVLPLQPAQAGDLPVS
jgi:tetratricopeptide (TPR) repeat protein